MIQAFDQSAAVDVTCPGCFHPQTWDAAAACPICHFRLSSQGRSAALLPVGTQLKNYVVGEKMGQGGFGITYRGFDVTLQMKVAIKEYFPSEMVSRATDHQMVILSSSAQKDSFQYCREAFLKEAQTIAQIRHPHIVRVLNFFEMNGTAYLVMDYYEGQDLAHHLNINLKDQPSRKLPWREAVNLLLPVLDGLQRVHQAGYMHRDIKPGNLYLTEDGLILLDFGSARQVTGTHTGSLLIFSAGFSPYEQYIEGQLDRQGSWTDVYAIAATLYVMITGYRLPSGLDRIQAQLRNQPDLLKPARFFVPEIPAALDAVLSRALAVEPDERTPAVGALKRELQVVLAAVEPSAVVTPPSAKTEGAATTVLQQLPPKLSPVPKSTADPLIRPQPDPSPKSSTVVKKSLMRLNLDAEATFLTLMLFVFVSLAAVFVGVNYWWQWRETVAQETKVAADKAAADKAAADKAAADKAAADKAVADKAVADKAADEGCLYTEPDRNEDVFIEHYQKLKEPKAVRRLTC